MLTDREIQNLITSPRRLKKGTLPEDTKKKSNYKRCDLKLETVSADDKSFSVFIRQNMKYIENFSIGLRYKTGIGLWDQ